MVQGVWGVGEGWVRGECEWVWVRVSGGGGGLKQITPTFLVYTPTYIYWGNCIAFKTGLKVVFTIILTP